MITASAVETLEKIHDIGEFNIIISVILVAAFVICIIEGARKLKQTLGITTKDELYKKEQEERIDRLANRIERLDKRTQTYESRLDEYADNLYNKQDKYHKQSIEYREKIEVEQKDIKDDIHECLDLIKKSIEKDNQRTVVTLRASLWRLHNEFISQDFVTPDALKTFIEMGKFYEEAGGDDIYHSKLKPEVEALEIRYPEGSIYNLNI